MVLQYLDFFERMREKEPPVSLEMFNENLKIPFETWWTIRVRGNKALERCRVNLDGAPLYIFENRTVVKTEAPLLKGGGLNFRIPSPSESISSNSTVSVLDGDKTIRERKWSDIPHTKP